MDNHIYKGGGRECIIQNPDTVIKRNLRMLTTPEFDVVDDYQFDDVDQQLTEMYALKYINRMAPDEVKKFFPRLICVEQKLLTKPTFSDTKLQTIYGYLAGSETTLEILKTFPAAKIHYETELVLERILPFEEIPFEDQKKFYSKGCSFDDFAKHYGATVDEINILHHWLKRHSKENYRKMDYHFTMSNWGLRPNQIYPVILDLGYFFF